MCVCVTVQYNQWENNHPSGSPIFPFFQGVYVYGKPMIVPRLTPMLRVTFVHPVDCHNGFLCHSPSTPNDVICHLPCEKNYDNHGVMSLFLRFLPGRRWNVTTYYFILPSRFCFYYFYFLTLSCIAYCCDKWFSLWNR